jgi:hypothetical protein
VAACAGSIDGSGLDIAEGTEDVGFEEVRVPGWLKVEFQV